MSTKSTRLEIIIKGMGTFISGPKSIISRLHALILLEIYSNVTSATLITKLGLYFSIQPRYNFY